MKAARSRGTRRAVEYCGTRREGRRLRFRVYRIPLTEPSTTRCGLGWSTFSGRNRPTGARQAGNRAAETLPDAASAPPDPRRVSLLGGREPAGTGFPVTLWDVAKTPLPDRKKAGASVNVSGARF